MIPQKKIIERSENPVLLEVDINHNCWFCDITEKDREADIVSTLSAINGPIITNIVQLTSPHIARDMEMIRNHRLVKAVEPIAMHKDRAVMKVSSSYAAMTYKILHKSNVMLLESPITRNGVDSEIILADSHKSMSELLSRWKEQDDYDVRLRKKRYISRDEADGLNLFKTSGFFDLKGAKELMSRKQMEIFRIACDKGYYEMPKRITLEELAAQNGVAPSTLAEHLRKAETKLLPILGRILGNI